MLHTLRHDVVREQRLGLRLGEGSHEASVGVGEEGEDDPGAAVAATVHAVVEGDALDVVRPEQEQRALGGEEADVHEQEGEGARGRVGGEPAVLVQVVAEVQRHGQRGLERGVLLGARDLHGVGDVAQEGGGDEGGDGEHGERNGSRIALLSDGEAVLDHDGVDVLQRQGVHAPEDNGALLLFAHNVEVGVEKKTASRNGLRWHSDELGVEEHGVGQVGDELRG